MILSMVVVVLLGTLLVHRIRSELLAAKQEVAFSEAGQINRAQQQFRQIDAASQDSRDQVVLSVLERMTSGAGQTGGQYVLLVSSGTATSSGSGSSPSPTSSSASSEQAWASQPDYPSGVLTREDIPTQLRHQVQNAEGPWWTYVSMPVPDSTPGSTIRVPSIAVGQQVYLPGGGPYELYLLFPLTQEQRTLAAVQQAVALTGLFLVLLVGLVAWLVARQVVRPVQSAAATAQRLAAGQLHERMPVRGEDELARLGTSFNKMAASLQRQIHQLEELSRLQRRFVSDVSHELRTPLTTVRMAADIIHDHSDSFDESMRRSSQLMQSQLDHFESLLADLLEISRFDAAAAVLETEPCDVGALALRVARALEPLASQHGSVIHLEVPSDHDAAGATDSTAQLDSRRIERVVRNLIANAIEHGMGRPIVVQVGADEHAVALSVRDFGIGLTDEHAQHVFDRFWRADPSRARTIGGTGLGLSIALEDVHLHGGRLQACGQPGQGALFVMTVPREHDQQVAQRGGQPGSDSPLPLSLDASSLQNLPATTVSAASELVGPQLGATDDQHGQPDQEASS